MAFAAIPIIIQTMHCMNIRALHIIQKTTEKLGVQWVEIHCLKLYTSVEDAHDAYIDNKCQCIIMRKTGIKVGVKCLTR